MMAVICFCLRPSAPAKFEGPAHKQTAAFRQLGSYIWVSPPENPQGLGYFTFVTHSLAREKVRGPRKLPWKPKSREMRAHRKFARLRLRNRGTRNPPAVLEVQNRVPTPQGPRVHARSGPRR